MRTGRAVRILLAIKRGDKASVTAGAATVALAELRETVNPMPPTPRGLEVLRVLADATRDHGIPPTLGEMSAVLGIAKVTVHQHLNVLEERGCVVRPESKARGNLEITERGHRFLNHRQGEPE